jgi:predicted SprT family Zn-dependent metalloprotease
MAIDKNSTVFQKRPHPKINNFKDMTGQRFGRLVALQYVYSEKNKAYWLFQCDCGNTHITHGAHARSGYSLSCGCLKKDKWLVARTKHGKAGSFIYGIWTGMKERCFNTKKDDFKNYGARGITICEHWKNDFVNFFTDMGNPPEGKYSIDRIDNDKHYSCGHCNECLANSWTANCRWATLSEQSVNKRSNRHLTLDGETKCVAEWARITGVPRDRIYGRKRSGWCDRCTLLLPNKSGANRSVCTHASTHDTASLSQ